MFVPGLFIFDMKVVEFSTGWDYQLALIESNGLDWGTNAAPRLPEGIINA